MTAKPSPTDLEQALTALLELRVAYSDAEDRLFRTLPPALDAYWAERIADTRGYAELMVRLNQGAMLHRTMPRPDWDSWSPWYRLLHDLLPATERTSTVWPAPPCVPYATWADVVRDYAHLQTPLGKYPLTDVRVVGVSPGPDARATLPAHAFNLLKETDTPVGETLSYLVQFQNRPTSRLVVEKKIDVYDLFNRVGLHLQLHYKTAVVTRRLMLVDGEQNTHVQFQGEVDFWVDCSGASHYTIPGRMPAAKMFRPNATLSVVIKPDRV